MSAVTTYLIGKYGSRSLQFYSLFVRCLSLQCRNVCRSKNNFGQHTLRPSSAVVGLGCFRVGITLAHLPYLSSGVRWFSDSERDKNYDKGNQDLKGVAFFVPHPVTWLKDKWYTYRIQSLVDPLFSLREFQVGAKQVWFLFVMIKQFYYVT